MTLQAISLMASIFLIFGGAYKKIPDVFTLGLSAIITGFSMGWSPGGVILTIIRATFSLETIELAACVGLIRVLGWVLQRYGILEKMASSLGRLLKSSRYAIMAVPALLGSLSVLGGAIMSAPLVDGTGDHLGISPARKAAVNVVFRHTVYFSFPLGTMLIFTATLAGVPVLDMIGVLWPLTLVMFLAGYLRLIRGTKDESEPSRVPYASDLKEFAVSSSPLWVAVLSASLFRVRLVFALVVGICLALAMSRKHPEFNLASIRESADLPTIGTIIGVMVFKAFVTEMSLPPAVMKTLSKYGIPPEAAAAVGIIAFAFMSGALQTGIAVGLPVLAAIATTYDQKLLYACFVYVVGFTAYLISPLHLCLVLTNRYFGVDLASVYREYWPVPAVTFLCGIMLYVVRKAIL